MKFGEALELCRQGKLIRRTGWYGKNQFVYYQEGSIVSAEDLRCTALKKWAYTKEGSVTLKIMGHFDIKTTAGVIQCGWLATQGDMQAEDWEVFE
jgi:hypothetical protein